MDGFAVNTPHMFRLLLGARNFWQAVLGELCVDMCKRLGNTTELLGFHKFVHIKQKPSSLAELEAEGYCMCQHWTVQQPVFYIWALSVRSRVLDSDRGV